MTNPISFYMTLKLKNHYRFLKHKSFSMIYKMSKKIVFFFIMWGSDDFTRHQNGPVAVGSK